jgi:hypothetical protein
MTNKFDDVFNYCSKISQKKIEDHKIFERRKQFSEKKRLYNYIITTVNINDLKNAACKGKRSHIIYESAYNKLIDDIIPNLQKYFMPFNVLYIKKSVYNKTFLQNFSEENTFSLYLSWNKRGEEAEEVENTKEEVENTKEEVENTQEEVENTKEEKIGEQKKNLDIYLENNYNDNNKLDFIENDYVLEFEDLSE